MDYKSALQSRGMLCGAGNCHISCRKVDSLTVPSCIIATAKERIHFFFFSRAQIMKRWTSCLYAVPQKHIYMLSFLVNHISVNEQSKSRSSTDLASFTFFSTENFICCLQKVQALVDVTWVYNQFLWATWKDRLSGKSESLVSSDHREQGEGW